MTSWDQITATSIGTGTTKTTLNAGNNLTKPTQAVEVIEIVPFVASSGALTAGESIVTKIIFESNSVDLLPKESLVPPVLAGLGTFGHGLSPMLDSIEYRTPLVLGATSQFQVSGQALESNTVAPEMGCSIHYSEVQSGKPEHFYNMPAISNTGTAATTVSGSDLTINGGRFLEDIYPLVAPGVVTASESYYGHMSITSNDFENSMPLKVSFQPISTGLGSAVSAGMVRLPAYHNIHMGMKSSAIISQSLVLEEALTAQGTWLAGYGYTKQ